MKTVYLHIRTGGRVEAFQPSAPVARNGASKAKKPEPGRQRMELERLLFQQVSGYTAEERETI